MEWLKNSNQNRNIMDTRKNGLGPASQRFMQVPSTTNANVRPPETTVSNSVRPVNYSIQTGEEFALEFMRERAISKKPSVPNSSGDQNNATGYMDFRVMLGLSHAGSESASDVSMVMGGDRASLKEIEKSNISESENKGRYASSRSAPRASSGVSQGFSSSGTYDSSSKKMKVLCSFGGKILPRPSDGKLRYVGGDTRIIRIDKDISWQELMQKTLTVYNQSHTIKYQLPGEDLDALVSVSCDEDLQNMMEECSFLEGGEGSQKLRVFLFSSSDFDDAQYGLAGMEGDSEIQYVVAVNGIDPGAGRTSSDHRLASTSASDMDQLFNLTVEVDRNAATRGTESAGVHSAPLDTVPFSGSSVSPTTTSSYMQPSDYDSHVHSSQFQRMHYMEGEGYPVATALPPDNFHNVDSRISIPGSVPSDYVYSSQYAPLGGITAPLPLSTHEGCMEGRDGTGVHNQGMKGSKSAVDNSMQLKSETENIQHLDNEFITSVQQHDDSVSKWSVKQQETAAQSPSIDTKDADEDSEFNEDDQYASGGAFTSGFSDYDPVITDPNSHPARVFHSERIPRHQAEFMNRLSKSDDSMGSQFLILQSQSGAVQESIAEGTDPLHEGNMVSQSGMSSAARAPPPNPATIEDGLQQFERYKELANTITGMKKPEAVSTPEGSKTTRILVLPVGEAVTSKGNSKVQHSDRKEAAEVESSPAGIGAATKPQENAASILPDIRWEEMTAKPATEQASAEPSVPAPEHILIDINDRFPRDLLSDFFSKARIAQDSSGLTPLRKDDAGISVNVQNHDPKRWSFFRNLAQGEFARKDVSLMDQDHIGYGSPLTEVEEGVSRPYGFTPLENEGGDLCHMDSQIDFDEELKQELTSIIEDDANVLHPGRVPSQAAHPQLVNNGEGLRAENPFPRVEETLQTIDSAYEELKFAIGEPSVPVLDASVGDIDFSNLQIIKNQDLEELRELGSGTFGTVYHGKWRGSDVAIKRIKKSCFTGRSSEQERLTLEFWREAEILSKLHHPNVVAFYGVVQDGPGGTLATVTEYMVNGSLRHVLLRKDKYLDRRKRLIIAMDAAFGMEYLHSKDIVHFDLKCDNLLVNLKDQSRPICKVGDFGLSKIKRNTLVSGGVRGTLPWMAPELLNGSSNKVSEKVDVFSFGIVMWEILTGEEPYANMHYGAIIGGIVNNTLRPPIPVSCDPEWRRLMEQCWAPDPQQRPSFTEIAGRLRAMSMASQIKTSK